MESICKQIDKEKVIICHRIASFLRLVLTQIPGTAFHCYLHNAVLERVSKLLSGRCASQFVGDLCQMKEA